jgi:hypothetical protein
MLKRLGWLVVGGFDVGIVGLSLAARLGADDLSGFAPWRDHWPFATRVGTMGPKSIRLLPNAIGPGTAATRSISPSLPGSIIAAAAAVM